jgi:TonB family protein
LNLLLVALLVGACGSVQEAPRVPEPILDQPRDLTAAYWGEVKERIFDLWQPSPVWKALPRERSMPFAGLTLVIVVNVELAATGEVRSVTVTKTSGVPELDDEAVRAFQAASPFSPPPAAAVRAGVVTFPFSFNFIVPMKW